jgi:hypothetical protein
MGIVLFFSTMPCGRASARTSSWTSATDLDVSVSSDHPCDVL